MRGFPKKIATGQDFYNCLSLVQAGALPANDLAAAIKAVEEREYISVPVLEISEDRRTVVINDCAEAEVGAKVKNTYTTTISAVQKGEPQSILQGVNALNASEAARAASLLDVGTANEQESETDQQKTELIAVTLSREVPENTSVLKILAETSPYDVLGISADEIKSIKGVLKNYE